MRLLVLAPTGFFADYGCHVRIRGQMAALQARGHQIRLVTYPSGREADGLSIVRPRAWSGQRAVPVGSSRRKLWLDVQLAPLAWAAGRRFEGSPPDLIHAYLHEGALLGILLARLWRRPLVFDVQGSLTAEMIDHRFLSLRSPWVRPLQRLERWIERQPQALLPSSGHAAARLRAAGVDPGRIHTLPDSVDPAVFRPRADFPPTELHRLRDELGIPAGRPLLVYLGLLAPYQGVDLLLHAMQILALRQPPPHLLLMGFPHVEHYRRVATRLGVADFVTFTGAVRYEDAPRLLALGDVAAAPKLAGTEGIGKVLPYMAASLPVVAFDTPAARGYLGEWGIYAAAVDAPALAAAVGWALDRPAAAAQAGQALRGRAAGEYTWDHAAAILEAVYASL